LYVQYGRTQLTQDSATGLGNSNGGRTRLEQAYTTYTDPQMISDDSRTTSLKLSTPRQCVFDTGHCWSQQTCHSGRSMEETQDRARILCGDGRADTMSQIPLMSKWRLARRPRPKKFGSGSHLDLSLIRDACLARRRRPGL
jgi:hypothetical protein